MAVPHLDEGGRRSRIQPVSHGSRSGGLETEEEEASSIVVCTGQRRAYNWAAGQTQEWVRKVRIKVGRRREE